MEVSEILNIVLGGGFVTLAVTVATMRATVRKANADAEKAKADAETVRITNTDTATRVLVDNIVKPLKEELYATREDLQATKRQMASTQREMARLRKAVEAASGCRHADYCPVLNKLRDNQEDLGAAGADTADRGALRQHVSKGKADHDCEDPREQGADGDNGGQPP